MLAVPDGGGREVLSPRGQSTTRPVKLWPEVAVPEVLAEGSCVHLGARAYQTRVGTRGPGAGGGAGAVGPAGEVLPARPE